MIWKNHFSILIQDYSAVLDGDTGALYKTVSDFNGDGLIDLYLKTVNYHGEEGKFPT